MRVAITQKQFGARLRERRVRMKISTSDLARRVGLSRKSILNIENGDRWPSLPRYFNLCQELIAGKIPLVDKP